jgi:hypothetical protein
MVPRWKNIRRRFRNTPMKNDNMSVDVKTYLAQLEKVKGKGKLGQWEAEIFQLFHAKASYQEIVEFLKLNGVKAVKIEVYRFIHCKKRRHLVNANAATDESLKDVEIIVKSSKEVTMTAPSKLHDVQSLESPGMPKFNWRDNRKKDKPKW